VLSQGRGEAESGGGKCREGVADRFVPSAKSDSSSKVSSWVHKDGCAGGVPPRLLCGYLRGGEGGAVVLRGGGPLYLGHGRASADPKTSDSVQTILKILGKSKGIIL